jgi:hypothetical protein
MKDAERPKSWVRKQENKALQGSNFILPHSRGFRARCCVLFRPGLGCLAPAALPATARSMCLLKGFTSVNFVSRDKPIQKNTWKSGRMPLIDRTEDLSESRANGCKNAHTNGEIMKKHAMLVLILSLLFCSSAIAQADLAGTWQGKLATSPNEKLTIQFIITRQANGSYSVVLNSPETGGIRNIAATGVKFADGKLTVDVASLSGSYSGTVAKNVITGEWKQAGSTFPLVLTPYKKPTVSMLKPLVGEWVGELAPPTGQKITAVFHFQISKNGELAGSADIPEQGQSGIPLSNIVLEGDEVSLKIAGGQADYKGKLIGNKIEGAVKQAGQEMKMNLVKGKYEIPGVALSPEDMKRLMGLWTGKFAAGGPSHTVVWRFEKRTDGKLKGTNAAPEATPQVLPITDLSLKGDQLAFKIPGAGGEFTGKLNGELLSGTFKAGGKELALNMKRGTTADLPTTQMDIPADSLKKLMGRWNGNIGPDTVVYRFERNPGGKVTANVDVVNKNVKDMLVVKATMTGENLVMKHPDGAEINLTFKGSKLEGNLKLNQTNLPVALTKQP